MPKLRPRYITAQWGTAAHVSDATHLELETPLADVKKGQRVKVLITFEPMATEGLPPGDFIAAISSYYRNFPNAKPMTTADYTTANREGERD